MCECSCAAQPYLTATRIDGTDVVLAVQVFPGCKDCDYGPGVSVAIFDSPTVELIEGLKLESIKADEYGGNSGYGLSVPVLDGEDLIAEARELCPKGTIGPGEDEYESLADWLDDNWDSLLRGAVHRRLDRWAKQREQSRENGGAR